MSKPVAQKISDPRSIGGNLTKQSTNSTAAKSIKMESSKRQRVPLKRVHLQPTSRITKNNPSSKMTDTKTVQQICSETVGACPAGKERAKENNSSVEASQASSGKSSRVKKVPDFKKLHDKWQQKIEKAKKEKRTAIEVKQFALTPKKKSNPSTAQTKSGNDKIEENPAISTKEETSPFKEDSASLRAILHGNGEEPPSLTHRATLAAGPRVIPGELRIPYSSCRHSMYRRRKPTALESGLYNSHKSPSAAMFSSVSHAQGRQLLTQLANSTLTSVRTVTKVNRSTTSDLVDVKMNLSSQLTAAATISEDNDGGSNQTPLQNLHLSGSNFLFSEQIGKAEPTRRCTAGKAPVITGLLPRDHFYEVEPERCTAGKAPVITGLLPRDHFYEVEPELCEILGQDPLNIRYIGGRGECPSPLARLLDKAYIIPVNFCL